MTTILDLTRQVMTGERQSKYPIVKLKKPSGETLSFGNRHGKGLDLTAGIYLPAVLTKKTKPVTLPYENIEVLLEAGWRASDDAWLWA